MDSCQKYIEQNHQWAAQTTANHPGFFEQLSQGQSPDCLWIGCSDSRVPPGTLLDLPPGSIFVHRNIANVVDPADPNCLSVIQYAVEALKVRHILVCGHYGCGGVGAAMTSDTHGSIHGWLEPIRGIYSRHRAELDGILDPEARQDRLCELNVIEQAARVCRTDPVKQAWASGRELQVHGWIYALKTGLIKDLNVSVSGPE
jgi:carbonic anhydrase